MRAPQGTSHQHRVDRGAWRKEQGSNSALLQVILAFVCRLPCCSGLTSMALSVPVLPGFSETGSMLVVADSPPRRLCSVCPVGQCTLCTYILSTVPLYHSMILPRCGVHSIAILSLEAIPSSR